MTAFDIVRLIETRQFPLTGEKRLQFAIEGELRTAGYPVEREVRLSAEDVIDFVVGNVGIEAKLAGQRRAIYRQCERYCLHDRIQTLVLATNVAMGMPAFINGRRVLVARLGKAWL